MPWSSSPPRPRRWPRAAAWPYCRCADRSAALPALAEIVIRQHEGHHRLHDWHRARQDTGVVPAPRRQRGLVAVHVHRLLLAQDGGGGLEGRAQHDGLAVADAALDAARPVGAGADLAARIVKGIVVLRAAQLRPLEAAPAL